MELTTFKGSFNDSDFPLRIQRMEPQNPTLPHDHEFSEIAVILKPEFTSCQINIAPKSSKIKIFIRRNSPRLMNFSTF